MDDFFKKIIYTGIGAVSYAAEKFEEAMDELVEKGKMTREEAEKFAEEFKEKTDRSKEDVEQDLKELLEKMLKKMDIAQKTELEALTKRVAELEAKANKEG